MLVKDGRSDSSKVLMALLMLGTVLYSMAIVENEQTMSQSPYRCLLR